VTSQITTILSQKMDIFYLNQTQIRTGVQALHNSKPHSKNKPILGSIIKRKHFNQVLIMEM
jgi:hypothetical protein